MIVPCHIIDCSSSSYSIAMCAKIDYIKKTLISHYPNLFSVVLHDCHYNVMAHETKLPRSAGKFGLMMHCVHGTMNTNDSTVK